MKSNDFGDVNAADVVLVTNVSKGILRLGKDGSLTYTSNHNYRGTDTFTYKLKQGNKFSNTAIVTLNVYPVNQAPIAVDDAYSMDEETTLTIEFPGVLVNDIDPGSYPMKAILNTNVSSGNLTLNVDGSFTYTPNANFYGIDTFTYIANDGTLNSNIATVTITVTPTATAANSPTPTATATITGQPCLNCYSMRSLTGNSAPRMLVSNCYIFTHPYQRD